MFKDTIVTIIIQNTKAVSTNSVATKQISQVLFSKQSYHQKVGTGIDSVALLQSLPI